MLDPGEVAAAVLEPHFDAVRDIFVEYELEPGKQLSKLKRTRMVVDPSVHDAPRHFARCRTDGLLIQLAPEAAELPLENLVAVLVHEFGHAADFAYPGNWVSPPGRRGEATWIGDLGTERVSTGDREAKAARRWRRLWEQRNDDQVEWAADAIGSTVTGMEITYCGPCMLQCFSGIERPAGLR